MKTIFKIKQKVSYVEILYTAQTETEMLHIVDVLFKGVPEGDKSCEITVTVEFEKGDNLDNF